MFEVYKYPIHRHCGQSDCNSAKPLWWHKRIKVDPRAKVAGFVWGHWFRAVRWVSNG